MSESSSWFVPPASSLPEVDPKRIVCAGLSGGGYRATYLLGTDSRIKAGVILGWMTSLPTTLDISYSVHANLFEAFGLHSMMDHPDVASLAAPDAAIFIQNCAQDRLFIREGMDRAVQKIERVYRELGRRDFFRFRYYDVPHQFNAEMQEDAFRLVGREAPMKGANRLPDDHPFSTLFAYRRR